MTSEAKTSFDTQLYGRWLSVLRLLTVILWVLFGCVFTGLLRLVIRPFSKWQFIRINTLWIVHPWSRGIVWILGMKILTEGKIKPNDQVIVSHHMGLIDSLMVMALSPCMVLSNKDIREIPFVGILLRFLGFVFLDRRQPRSLIKTIAVKRKMLRQSRINVAFFPEGFVRDGNEVGAFHSSLFALAESHDVDIQPIVFRCTAINGIPLSFQDAPFFLFNAEEQTIVSYLAHLFRWKTLTIETRVLSPIGRNEIQNNGWSRQDVSKRTEGRIREAFNDRSSW